MLEEVMRYINNRFENGYVKGTFTIEGGTLEVEGAQDGQYLWIEGSVFNDGLHVAPLRNLHDETFTGKIALLVVPSAVKKIARDIEAWQEANAKVLDSPFQSESFGGYSYTKESGDSNGNRQEAWQAKFGPKLRHWRKLHADWN